MEYLLSFIALIGLAMLGARVKTALKESWDETDGVGLCVTGVATSIIISMIAIITYAAIIPIEYRLRCDCGQYTRSHTKMAHPIDHIY